jgi:nitrogen regulatory protein PII
MTEISEFIQTDNFTQIAEVLRKHDAGGKSFYEINGTGRGKRDAKQEITEAYMTGKSINTDHKRRIKNRTILPDWRFIRRQTKLEVFAN